MTEKTTSQQSSTVTTATATTINSVSDFILARVAGFKSLAQLPLNNNWSRSFGVVVDGVQELHQQQEKEEEKKVVLFSSRSSRRRLEEVEEDEVDKEMDGPVTEGV